MKGYQVRYISERFSHHAAHSGYDLLGPFLGSPVPSLDITQRSSRVLPWRFASWFVHRAGVAYYGPQHFYHEFSAAVDIVRHEHTIYHFLHGDSAYRYLGRLRGFRQNRIVATFHHPPKKIASIIHNPSYLRDLDALVVVGRKQMDYFAHYVERERIYWVPHSVDTDFFLPLPCREGVDRPICLSVGSHLRDFATLRQVAANLVGEVNFLVVTLPENASHFDSMPNVSVKIGIPDWELRQLYQTCTIFIQSLEDATANNAMLEAMSCGAPMVLSDVGSVRDYVDETCAVLVAPGDSDLMTKAIQDLLADDDGRERLGRASREVAEKFSFQNVANRMHEVYEHVMKGG